MRFIVSFVCCTRACAWVVSGGNSGGLRVSESSLFENTSFRSWRWRFEPSFSDTLRRVESSVFGLQDQCFS